MTYNQLRLYVIAALGLVGVVSLTLYTGTFNQTTRLPNPLTIDGQTITFPYTDKLDGECLGIFTSTSTYNNGLSHAEVYAAVVNGCATAQDVELAAYFRAGDERKRVRNVHVAAEVTQEYFDPVYTEQCETLATGTNCVSVQTGTTTRQETKTIWAPLPTTVRDAAETLKEAGYLTNVTREQVEGFASQKKAVAFPLRRGEVVYYKVLVEFPPNQADEFMFEAIGSDGGYGFLR